ncbi:MAG: tetratricopeptide repeat protein [Acidobacteriota bacterium]
MKYLVVFLSLGALIFPVLSGAAKIKELEPRSPVTSRAAEPNIAPTPKRTTKTADEAAEYDAAAANTDPAARIAALQKFIGAHPKSAKAAAARELLVKGEAEAANASLTSGDTKTAAAMFMAAVQDAPTPIPDQMFTDVISVIPTTLFWRGERAAAFESAAAIEAKSSTDQLLKVADFYLNVENGAEAKRIALAVIDKTPASSRAYLTLGLADRVDFQLEDSAAAYAKALELDPESVAARRGLAEMKRALGLPDEAAVIYRELLAKDAENVPASTGLILSLFEAGKRTEAESEMAASLASNPGNVMLLAGAAYWYSAHGDGKNAIEFAQKAIATDPRFIWSHIALARGYEIEKQPLDAERTLLAARRYGNFPTLEYEIASARLKAGFYREAAEELAKSFSVKDGLVSTKLGGRISRESTDLAELIAPERRASIAAPIAGDPPETAERLRDLLDLWQKLDAKDADADSLAKAADIFARGDDNMRVHRQLFAAKELLDRKKDVAKAAELARAAIGNASSALEVVSPSAAVMADELYDSRRLAEIRSEYIRVPDIPRATLLNIVRGRIEELAGRALFEMGNTAEAATRLKRAVGILPTGSSWWRSSSWRLGSALEAEGKAPEALEQYIHSYASGAPDVIRYSIIATLYQRVNGNLDGLESKIGPDPSAANKAMAKSDPQPAPTPETRSTEPLTTAQPEPSPTAAVETAPIATPEATPAPSATPSPEPTTAQTPDPTPARSPDPSPLPTPEPTPVPEIAKPEPALEKAAEPAASPTPKPAISETTALATPSPTPPDVKPEPVPEPSPTPATIGEAKPEIKPEPTPAETTTAVALVSPEPSPTPKTKTFVDIRPPSVGAKELFPPVVITIPPPASKTAALNSEKTEPEAIRTAPAPCTLTFSDSTLTLQNKGGDLAVIVGTEDDRDLTGLTAVSSDPKNVEIRREAIDGIIARSLFILRSVTEQTGSFQVTFTLPCGRKELPVTVR